MAYADYDFYKNTYFGKLPESEYRYFSERASDYIDSKTGFVISVKGIDSFPAEIVLRIKKCTAAVAECLAASKVSESGALVSSESVGDHSRTYVRQSRKEAEKRLEDILLEYLPEELLSKKCRWI